MGRGVEHAMASHLGALARERRLPAIRLQFEATAKNEPARQFLNSLGLAPGEESLVLPADRALTVTYQPEVAAEKQDETHQPAKPEKSAKRVPFDHFELIARTLTCPLDILRQVEQQKRNFNSNAVYTAPRNELETGLCRLWARILRIDRVGVTDNFFDLGGHSLSATRLVAEIYSEWGVQAPIKTVFEYPRLEDFARMIERELQGNLSGQAEKPESIKARHGKSKSGEVFEL
jgi:hypothetical protein